MATITRARSNAIVGGALDNVLSRDVLVGVDVYLHDAQVVTVGAQSTFWHEELGHYFVP